MFSSLLNSQLGVSGSGTLLSIHFDTLAAGISPLHFDNLTFLDHYGFEIAITAVDGTVGAAAAAVPEPASGLLLGIGAWAVLARRRGAAATLAR